MKKYIEPVIIINELKVEDIILNSPMAEKDPYGNDKDWILPV